MFPGNTNSVIVLSRGDRRSRSGDKAVAKCDFHDFGRRKGDPRTTKERENAEKKHRINR